MSLHQDLANGRWFTFSLAEQLGNVGSEVSRAVRWQKHGDSSYWGAVTRAFELMDLTIADPRWRHRLKEILRVREVMADAVFGGKEYETTWDGLIRYFDVFALQHQAMRLRSTNAIDNERRLPSKTTVS